LRFLGPFPSRFTRERSQVRNPPRPFPNSLHIAINRFSRNHGITAVFQHDVHPQMQRCPQGDEWWIADIVSRGMRILTQDSAILGVRQHKQGIITGERQPVIESAAHRVCSRKRGLHRVAEAAVPRHPLGCA
jgi:hypothetical protein